MTRHICLHGAESTGKSSLAPRLALRLGGLVVPEYGRTYAEANGTDLDEVDLLAIFDGHRAATEAARAQRPAWLVSDTDPLMTQAWAIMLLGRRLPEIDLWDAVADLYLVPAMDLPWQEDGTRLFGLACGRCDNPYTHGALENFRIAGDTLEFDIVHQDWGDGTVLPFSRHVVAHIAMNEMRMDARRPDQTGPGIVASLVGPIAIEATAGNVYID